MTFHIHVDAEWLSQEYEEFLKTKLGFWRTDFVCPDGASADPPNILTLTPSEPAAFKAAYASAVDFASGRNVLRGYIEGEFIAKEMDIPQKDYDPKFPIPFTLKMAPLRQGDFKQAEMHLTLCAERSQPALLAKLREMGFMIVYMPKPRGIAVIFTAQGTIPVIARLVERVTEFLSLSGGAVNCDIKQEHIAKWWLSDETLRLPPVVSEVEYLSR